MFLVTTADGGSRLVYFIAQNARHSTLPEDLQVEQTLNSLWPVRLVSRDEVLAFPEAAPVGGARTGLLAEGVVAEPSPVDEAPAAAETPVATESPAVYVLQPGDNLIHLSDRYSTTVQAILTANNLTNPNRVYVGQSLLIPSTASAASESPDASGLASVPAGVESPAPPLPVAADAPDPVADVPAVDDAVTYTVMAGDSAIHIARQFGVEVAALLAANSVANPNRVYIGQVLSIPGA